MSDLDLGDLIQQGLSSVRSGIQGVVSDVSDAVTGAKSAQETTARGISTVEQGTELADTADAAAKEKLAGDNAASAALIGNSPGAASELIRTVGNTVLGKEQQLVGLQDKLEQRAGVSVFDDPISWLTNKFTTPFVKAQAEQLTADIAQRTGTVKALQTMTSDAERDNATVDVVNARLRAEALNKQATGLALTQLGQSQDELAKLGLQAANVRLATTTDQFSTTLGYANAQNSITRLNIEQQQLDITKSYRDAQEERIKLEDKIRAGNDQDKTDFESKLKPAAASVGLDITTAYQFDHATTAQKGVLLDIIGTQSGMVGDPYQRPIAVTPAGALSRLDTLGTMGGSPGMAKIVTTLNDYKQGAGLTKDGQPDPIYGAAKPEVRIAMEDASIKNRVDTEIKNIPAAGGIYSPNPLTSVLNIPVISQLPLVKDMVPLAKNTQYATKPDDFMATAMQRIHSGKETPETAAAQIAATFSAVAADNNQVRQYGRLAIPGLSIGQYNMTVHALNGRSQVINMADPTAIRNYLTRQSINSFSQKVLADSPAF